jgi:hypothetical protein
MMIVIITRILVYRIGHTNNLKGYAIAKIRLLSYSILESVPGQRLSYWEDQYLLYSISSIGHDLLLSSLSFPKVNSLIPALAKEN